MASKAASILVSVWPQHHLKACWMVAKNLANERDKKVLNEPLSLAESQTIRKLTEKPIESQGIAGLFSPLTVVLLREKTFLWQSFVWQYRIKL